MKASTKSNGHSIKAEAIAAAYREQQVDWPEAEILRRSSLVATEYKRMEYRSQNLLRKVRQYEFNSGELDPDVVDLRGQIRFQDEMQAIPYKAAPLWEEWQSRPRLPKVRRTRKAS